MTNRLPFVGSGRVQEAGALATRKQDFNAHVQGNGFRHDATQIDMNPVIPLVGGTTVQQTLEHLHTLIVSAGTGFLSIGSIDGYIQGDYNVGNAATPTLYDTFNAAFADTRVQNGGVILVLAGTYHLRATVTVPAGISIIGEIAGTTIIGEMQEVPMFIVQKPDSTINMVAGIPVDVGSNVDTTHFMNMILADNMDGYVLFGEPTMTTVPMIQAKVGSNLVCENVSFIGRIHSGATPRTKTQAAIGYSGVDTSGTVLRVRNCYLDGLRNGIMFTPANNEKDFLTVSQCKARIYGTENAASQTADLNCFIQATHCNASILNNHFVGAGLYVSTFLMFVSGNGTNTKVVVSGNTGNPQTIANGHLVLAATGANFTSIITGNSWGSMSIDSPWYVVVGGGTGNVTSTLGDFNGSGAIDTILSIAKNIPDFQATVIVNPGIYTITGGGAGNTYANLSFIGNKHGKSYPVFNLNLSNFVSDSLGNAPVALGNKLQSIKFMSTGSIHSIRPGFNPTSASGQDSAHLLEVLDCIFLNTALYAQDLSAAPWVDDAGKAARTEVVVKDCYFFQDGTFTDTVSCMLPRANEVVVQSCHFTGNGYALSIGENGYTIANGSSTSNVSIKDSVFDLTGYTISTLLTLGKNYIRVDVAATLSMENCQVYSNNQYNNSTPIGAGLTNSLTQPFGKFVHLKSDNIYVDKCVFVGPAQTFVSSAVTYAMTTLFVEPTFAARITNSRFNSGACLLQTGLTAMTDGSFRESFIIDGCYFNSAYHTLVDYDLSALSQDAVAHFVISNCNFINGIIAEKPLHTNTTDTARSGAVQLFVGDGFVEFTNNIMNVNISSVTGKTLYGALMINAYDNLGASGDQIAPIKVSDNTIYGYNHVTSATATVAAACMLLRSSSIHCQNNTISQWNAAVVSASFIGCLIIDNPETAVNNESRAIITGNTFGRKNFGGVSSNLARGYIQITSTSSVNNGGMISNNVFDSTTYNGTSTALVEDNTLSISNNISLSNWIITHNKNQVGRQLITFSSGSKGIATGGQINLSMLYGGTASPSYIYGDETSPEFMHFNYQNTTIYDQFRWVIPLTDVLPSGVTITKVDLNYQATVVPGTMKTLDVTLSGADGDTSSTNTIVDTNIHSVSLTPTFNYTTKDSDHPFLYIEADINHTATLLLKIFQVYITYHW